MRAALAVTVVVLGISGTGCAPRLPGELDVPSDRDNFFHVVAVNLNAPELCGRINPRADGGGGALALAGYQVTSLQSSCYRILADAMHAPSLCDRVVPVRTLTLDGSKMDKADCLSGRESGTIVTPDPNAMGPFVALMQSVGYGDREVLESEYQENPENSSTFAEYSRLRDDPAFLLRLQSAPSYQEPRSNSDTRSAHPIEFLYQMVAVERGDAALCAKVSPNATFADSSEKPALLQSTCYLHLAFNTRQEGLCDPLPRAGSSPLINENYDSYERCRDTVAVYNRPTFQSATHYGPHPFPHAADFPAALEAAGYPATYTSTLVPKPASSSYWDFVSRLRFQETDADRAEFVQRVVALR
jgi:hypothetical protein